MICEKCGAQNDNGIQFCCACGNELPTGRGGNGFADILVYGDKTPDAGQSGTGASAERLERKLESLVRAKDKTIRTQRITFCLTGISFVLAFIGTFLPRMNTERVSARVLNQIQFEMGGRISGWDDQISLSLAEVDQKVDEMEKRIRTFDEKQGENDETLRRIDNRLATLEMKDSAVGEEPVKPDETSEECNTEITVNSGETIVDAGTETAEAAAAGEDLSWSTYPPQSLENGFRGDSHHEN